MFQINFKCMIITAGHNRIVITIQLFDNPAHSNHLIVIRISEIGNFNNNKPLDSFKLFTNLSNYSFDYSIVLYFMIFIRYYR